MKIFTKQEAYEASLEYFRGDSAAAKIWADKYALKDADGNLYEKTPDAMHKRLAKNLARIENNYRNPVSEEKIYSLLRNFTYLVPQGGPMAGIGNDFVLTSLSNCFVVPSAKDSYGGIMFTDQQQVQLMKRRGGVGHDMSKLRPVNTLANGTKLKGDTGMPLYMHRFSNSTREVAQDNRRGALMLSVSINHPDSDRFIDMKLDTEKVTGANVSVRITDEFMESVEDNTDFIQTFPIDLSINQHTAFVENYSEDQLTKGKLYPLKYEGDEEYKGTYAKIIDAKELWAKIINGAWKSAEPGILFWDTILSESPAAGYGPDWKEESTNPCGEIPLNPYDSCRLLAINLYSYVENPFTVNSFFNYDKFKEHVTIAQRLMDDIVDLEIEKLDKIIDKITSDPEEDYIKSLELDLWKNIRSRAKQGRRTGLGITGEGDMLAAMGYTYGTEYATKFAEDVHKTLAVTSYTSSITLARERGAFPLWSYYKDQESNFIKRVQKEFSYETTYEHQVYGRRNIGNLTIAPTGTTSFMTQTTSGIEPTFLPVYKRRRKTEDPSKSVFVDESGDMWEEFVVVHHKLRDWYNINKIGEFGIDKKEIEELTDDELDQIVKLSPYYKATSADVDHFEKVKMQGSIQKWVDHSISVTINVPKETTKETIDKLYTLAWKYKCKGVTVYRDGSRSGVLLSNKEEKSIDTITYANAPKRPKTLKVDIYNKVALGKSFTIVVGVLDGKPYEIMAFDQISQQEFPNEITVGTLTRVNKHHYRLEGFKKDKKFIIDNIMSLMSDDEKFQTRDLSRDLRYGIPIGPICDDIDRSSFVSSFRKVMGRVLKNYLTNDDVKDTCPDPNCGAELTFKDGCKTCPTCGWSACG